MNEVRRADQGEKHYYRLFLTSTRAEIYAHMQSGGASAILLVCDPAIRRLPAAQDVVRDYAQRLFYIYFEEGYGELETLATK